MKKSTLFFAAISVILTTGALTLAVAQEKHQMTVYVKGAGPASGPLNAALGKPIEAAFKESGKFATDYSNDFAYEIAKFGKEVNDANMTKAGKQAGVRFVCVIDAANVELTDPRQAPISGTTTIRLVSTKPHTLSGSTTISIFDVAQGQTVGMPQTIPVPPTNVVRVAQQLVAFAISASNVSGSTSVTQTSPTSPREKPRLRIRPITKDSGNDGETITALISIQGSLQTAFNIVSDFPDYILRGQVDNYGDLNLLTVGLASKDGLVAGGYRLYKNIEEIPDALPYIAENIAAATNRADLRLPTLAVAPFGFETDAEESIKALSQILPIAVANTGMYTVSQPHTSAVIAALYEVGTRDSDLTIEDKAKVVNKITNAENVLFVETRSLGNMNMLIMRIIKVTNGSQIAGESLNYRTMEDAAEQLPQVVARLTGSAPTAVAMTPTIQQQPAFHPQESSRNTTDFIGNDPAQESSRNETDFIGNDHADDTDGDSDVGGDKWLYFGGSLGLVRHVFTQKVMGHQVGGKKESGFIFQIVTDFALSQFISIESGVVISDITYYEIASGGELRGNNNLLDIPVIAKFGGKGQNIEFTGDIGYILIDGRPVAGSTFGFKVGSGIMYARYLYYFSKGSSTRDKIVTLTSDAWALSFGFKIGVGIDKPK